jgi:hypothetical protein
MIKKSIHFLFFCLFACNSFLFSQDLTTARVAIISFTGAINEDILNGLDPRDLSKAPHTAEEKDLKRRIDKRLEKRFLEDAYDILRQKLDQQGIKMEPLSTSAKIANLNEKGFPNPLAPKNVIKKRNENYADFFLNIDIVCSKPFLGGLLGFKPEARIRMVLHDAQGNKINTINGEAKDAVPLKSTDFDEAWTNLIERFNRFDWHSVSLLEERLMPLVEVAIENTLSQL